MRNRAASALAAMFVGGLLLVSGAPVASAQQPAGCPAAVPPGRPPGRPPAANPGAEQGPNRPANYPAGRCGLALGRSFAERGGSVSASGNGFAPGEEVVLSVAGQRVKTVRASSNGTFATDIVVPANAPLGNVEVTAASNTQVLSASLEVVAAGAGRTSAAPSSGTLPRTGTELVGLGAVGAGLVGVGAAAVVMTRRRKVETA